MNYLQCPCCGCAGAEPDGEGWFCDGQPLICGCHGIVSCDGEEPPYVIVFECECSSAVSEGA